MNIAQVRERVSGGGFRPFAIQTSDGREYPVEHPEWVLIASRSIAVLTGRGLIATLDPLHIVALTDLPQKRNAPAKSK